MKKTHYLRKDFREASLFMTIKGLIDTIAILEKQIEEIHWYDGDWFREESEPIYGLAFIAFQNYIIGSIKDFANSTDEKVKYYKIVPDKNTSSKSKIELIISLANYSKHKEEGEPHKGTKETLDYFNIKYDNLDPYDEFPIHQGLTILDKDWNLMNIKNYVTAWRENLWASTD